ncbi:Lcl C-terminal domain-containing protein [Zooshikella harenae]|uniref:DUF1566 domain-containing protein n=1 Tax=Zooshikella harenae TaxID=2827238 RepID=A0ABS5ZEE6_9GAMM|nr:DUF1566 domain-containing protein [Zooshikella harenae]MBU2712436.1 DUF1566 domain-containing protein [Zooshikella harenae]
MELNAIKNTLVSVLAFSASMFVYGENNALSAKPPYAIVDSGVTDFYNNHAMISKPKSGEAFYGQDAHYQINTPNYTDNGDGTITDNVTGLMWQKNMGEKIIFSDAFKYAKKLKLGGYSDWRVPTIKELYSLIQFTGSVRGQRAIKPFIDTRYFNQPLGNSRRGEREIDAQTWSSTEYVARTMGNDETVFGVNFVDGRIKGYPKFHPRRRQANKMYFRFVRGNKAYGKNNFVDNKDGTVTDVATGLMWQKDDSRRGMAWGQGLQYAENLKLAGYDDWRLPNAKELQSIVDYSKSPQTHGSAAINSVFKVSKLNASREKNQFPYYWTSTTHLDGRNLYDSAVYIAFGAALGRMHGRIMDVHGAGAQRSDPKSGNANNYPRYFGPQGDLQRVYNYVRCVRSAY